MVWSRPAGVYETLTWYQRLRAQGSSNQGRQPPLPRRVSENPEATRLLARLPIRLTCHRMVRYMTDLENRYPESYEEWAKNRNEPFCAPKVDSGLKWPYQT